MSQGTNRIPPGFLDLLGAETGGKYPPVYADTVQPTVPMWDFYLADTYAAYNFVFTVASEGAAVTIDIPNDEAWLLRSASAFFTQQVANETIAIGLRAERLPRGSDPAIAGFPSLWRSAVMTSANVGERLTEAFWFPAPPLFRPGQRLSFIGEQVQVAAGRIVRLQLLYNKLRVGTRP